MNRVCVSFVPVGCSLESSALLPSDLDAGWIICRTLVEREWGIVGVLFHTSRLGSFHICAPLLKILQPASLKQFVVFCLFPAFILEHAGACRCVVHGRDRGWHVPYITVR